MAAWRSASVSARSSGRHLTGRHFSGRHRSAHVDLHAAVHLNLFAAFAPVNLSLFRICAAAHLHALAELS